MRTKPQHVQMKNTQARLSPKQELAAFIALLRTFTSETTHPLAAPESQNLAASVQKKTPKVKFLFLIVATTTTFAPPQRRPSQPDKVQNI